LGGLDDDIDILDLVSGMNAEGEKATTGRRGKAHKKTQKWGKKGKKLRDKDPYGCHRDDSQSFVDTVAGTNKANYGLNTSAGKYGDKGYTRPNATYSGKKDYNKDEK